MRLRIIHAPEYSRGKWRIVDDNGDPIGFDKLVTLDDGTVTILPEIACAETKSGCVDVALELLGRAYDRIDQLYKMAGK